MISTFFILVVAHAYYNHKLIQAKKTGRYFHLKQGALYAAATALIWLLSPIHWAWIAALSISFRLAFFDPFLNDFQGLPMDYEGDPRNPHRSLTDRLEAWTGVPIVYLRCIYIALALLIGLSYVWAH